MASLTSPPIDWDGPEPTNTSALVAIAAIEQTSHVHMDEPLVSPSASQLAVDPAIGYATTG